MQVPLLCVGILHSSISNPFWRQYSILSFWPRSTSSWLHSPARQCLVSTMGGCLPGGPLLSSFAQQRPAQFAQSQHCTVPETGTVYSAHSSHSPPASVSSLQTYSPFVPLHLYPVAKQCPPHHVTMGTLELARTKYIILQVQIWCVDITWPWAVQWSLSDQYKNVQLTSPVLLNSFNAITNHISTIVTLQGQGVILHDLLWSATCKYADGGVDIDYYYFFILMVMTRIHAVRSLLFCPIIQIVLLSCSVEMYDYKVLCVCSLQPCCNTPVILWTLRS